MNYGIELEFFVKRDNNYIPAYLVTSNIDGNPVIGELKTKVHNNIVDCIFELKKLIYLETEKLKKKNCSLELVTEIKVDDSFIKNLREEDSYINNKELRTLKLYSIYGKSTGKVLPSKVYKASLQLNISDNKTFYYDKYSKLEVDDKYKYEKETISKLYSSIFDYVSIIRKLDESFKENIKNSKRIKGVFAIKEGELGNRIEYRSLPNNINLDKLIKEILEL